MGRGKRDMEICGVLVKMRRRVNTLFPAIILVLFVEAAVGSASDKKSPEVPALFIFGDSLADTGTNDYIPGYSYPPLPQANIVPYGESFFPAPTGRWSNGRLMFDFIAEYLKLPFPEPFLKPGAKFGRGACFASAGSGVLDSTFAEDDIIPLSKQLEQFEQLVTELKEDMGNDRANYIVSKSLYAFVCGNNDLFVYISNSTLSQTITPEEFIGTVISKLEEVILLVTGVNAKMNATVVILSTARYNITLDLILNGTSKGFTAGITGCCGSGPFNGQFYGCGRGNYTLCSNVSNYVYWDFTHPTERVNHIVAHQMWNGNMSYVQPMNIHNLSCL